MLVPAARRKLRSQTTEAQTRKKGKGKGRKETVVYRFRLRASPSRRRALLGKGDISSFLVSQQHHRSWTGVPDWGYGIMELRSPTHLALAADADSASGATVLRRRAAGSFAFLTRLAGGAPLLAIVAGQSGGCNKEAMTQLLSRKPGRWGRCPSPAAPVAQRGHSVLLGGLGVFSHNVAGVPGGRHTADQRQALADIFLLSHGWDKRRLMARVPCLGHFLHPH